MDAPPQGISSREIQRSIEEYEDMSEETFTRRLHADRDDFRKLGIKIESSRDSDGFSEVNFYRLPPENYFLPEVDFSPGELAALHTCLCLLDGQFAYSRPLRLALQSLALGTGNPLDDPVTDHVNVNLLTAGFDAAVARSLKKIDSAVLRRKTVVFDYYAISRDEVSTHTVDPYVVMVTRGDWYVVGYSHERDAVRVFKLRRIRGRIRNKKSKEDHNFQVPESFNAADYLSLEPWQLGPLTGSARITFSPTWGWWAKNNFSHCGDVELADDGSAVLTTGYADAGQLCSLVLGLWQDARIDEPDELKEQVSSLAAKIKELHSGPPPEFAGGAGEKDHRPPEEAAAVPSPEEAAASSPPEETPLPAIEPERFSSLATTVTYLMDRLGGEDSIEIPLDEVCRDLGYSSSGELERDTELLQLVSFGGGGGYLIDAFVEGDRLRAGYWQNGDLLRRPPRLSPLEARALLLAIDLIGSQVLSGQFASLESARDKIIKAAGGLGEDKAIPVGETEKDDFGKCSAINRGLHENRLLEIEYLSRDGGGLTRRTIEPMLLNNTRGQWLLIAFCRLREKIRTFRFEMIKSVRLLDEGFELRSDIDLDRYRRDPRFPSGRPAPDTATVWFSPRVARWVREKHPGVTVLKDGSVIGEIPYFGSAWMVGEVLKYRGEAVVLSPASLRKGIAEAAGLLA